ncbi:MAG: hypothetical protein U0903_21440 [Planctomycetales bacterium]
MSSTELLNVVPTESNNAPCELGKFARLRKNVKPRMAENGAVQDSGEDGVECAGRSN